MNSKRRTSARQELSAPTKEFECQTEGNGVRVKLLRSDFIARSEARRLLANLGKFREIVLDFRDVRSVGQGFADEVFRVFANRNPEIMLRAENAVPAVMAMIRHVSRDSSADASTK
jgi:hypothetical protein